MRFRLWFVRRRGRRFRRFGLTEPASHYDTLSLRSRLAGFLPGSTRLAIAAARGSTQQTRSASSVIPNRELPAVGMLRCRRWRLVRARDCAIDSNESNQSGCVSARALLYMYRRSRSDHAW
jgi:hypothetical protein